MLTYNLKKEPGVPLYEDLYRHIREDILSGRLTPGEKLPSKRALAQNLEISKITVEAAYEALLSEGYIRSRQRQGYFVEAVARPRPEETPREVRAPSPAPVSSGSGFPFSIWSRLQRQVMLDRGQQLLTGMPNTGVWELKQAIASHLRSFRAMEVDPENILVGAGTDFLYNLLIQLLGRDMCYAVEEPGYHKIRSIYRSAGVRIRKVGVGTGGIRPEDLADARVLHFSPSHHYPTGIITPMSTRQALIRWARDTDSWIIEDDYDSEFRYQARPMAAMQFLAEDRVIYMNSFSKTLAPSIRISYMVLPRALMEKFHRELDFYSCTVPSFEQYTLAEFISRGYFEKHINRMRKFYRSRRNALLELLQTSPMGDKITVLEQDAGLHFLLKLQTDLSDRALEENLREASLPFPTLSSFYEGEDRDLHCLVVSYDSLEEEKLKRAMEVLKNL